MTSLVIEQKFPLGRFHATRWNQNPFEDPHGEWPPSTWRFLRALAARWAQFRRETGAPDDKPRDALLNALSFHPPAFRLPPNTSRGKPLRQYVPVEVGWTNASAGVAAVRKPGKTLVPDAYRIVPPDEAVYWKWDLPEPFPHRELLSELLPRTLYFGRAETMCLFRLLNDKEAASIEPNCFLRADNLRGVPVLIPQPELPLNLASLLAATDDKMLVSRRIPPGSMWYYADLPIPRPHIAPSRPAPRFPEELHVIQFALGGRVFPPLNRWVKVTERFRGSVLRRRAQQLSGDSNARYEHLNPTLQSKIELLSGKDATGQPLIGNRHAYFVLWPDEHNQPTRLLCYRPTPFTSEEVEAMLEASNFPVSWDAQQPDWSARLVPLPFDTPEPLGFRAKSAVWESATPFVAAGKRRRFRENGRERPGETSEAQIAKLLKKAEFPAPIAVELIDDANAERFVYVHTTRQQRKELAEKRTPAVKPANRFRIVFAEPVSGPICIGHSAHFGLGLFVPSQ
jgi:CRISPR-associated protein Csb2